MRVNRCCPSWPRLMSTLSPEKTTHFGYKWPRLPSLTGKCMSSMHEVKMSGLMGCPTRHCCISAWRRGFRATKQSSPVKTLPQTLRILSIFSCICLCCRAACPREELGPIQQADMFWVSNLVTLQHLFFVEESTIKTETGSRQCTCLYKRPCKLMSSSGKYEILGNSRDWKEILWLPKNKSKLDWENWKETLFFFLN